MHDLDMAGSLIFEILPKVMHRWCSSNTIVIQCIHSLPSRENAEWIAANPRYRTMVSASIFLCRTNLINEFLFAFDSVAMPAKPKQLEYWKVVRQPIRKLFAHRERIIYCNVIMISVVMCLSASKYCGFQFQHDHRFDFTAECYWSSIWRQFWRDVTFIVQFFSDSSNHFAILSKMVQQSGNENNLNQTQFCLFQL